MNGTGLGAGRESALLSALGAPKPERRIVMKYGRCRIALSVVKIFWDERLLLL